MKLLRIAAILIFITIPLIIGTGQVVASAANKTFFCDPNTEPDLAGYKLYYGNRSGYYTQTIDTAKQLGSPAGFTVTGLTTGFYCFVATAYDTFGNESGYSNEVCLQIDETAPAAPVNLRIQ